MPAAGCIHVVAAAVTAPDGRVLIAQRPPGKHLAGAWEFPGGKLEPGESRTDALARELQEELGIVIREPRPLIRIRHTYPYGEVLIDMWVVTRYSGLPAGLDGQAIRWCTLDEAASADLLPADRPIVRALRLPERLREASSPDYEVLGASAIGSKRTSSPDGHERLAGALCATVEEGCSAAAHPVDFLVMRRGLGQRQIAALCASVSLPVYIGDGSLHDAWCLGATGLAEFPERGHSTGS